MISSTKTLSAKEAHQIASDYKLAIITTKINSAAYNGCASVHLTNRQDLALVSKYRKELESLGYTVRDDLDGNHNVTVIISWEKV